MSDGTGKPLESGTGLAMSGGGFRATLFHVGSLWRLNELGLLRSLTRISSVSGGSITNGVLALAWPKLDFDAQGVAKNFEELVVQPLRRFPADQLGLCGVRRRDALLRWRHLGQGPGLAVRQLPPVLTVRARLQRRLIVPRKP